MLQKWRLLVVMAGGVAILAGVWPWLPPQTRPLVLYLVGTPPPSAPNLARVDAGYMHLGSLSLDPPATPSQRSCGDVVAFAPEVGALPQRRYFVKDVLYRVWWESGSQHAHFSLNSPTLDIGIAQLSLAECERPADDPGRQGGYTLAMGRIPVGKLLSAQELEGLYLAIDVADSAVRVGTCPSRASLVVLNPPSDDELRGRDQDSDGVDDLEELHDPFRDPFRADPQDVACLPPINQLSHPPRAPLAALPVPTRTLRGETVEGDITLHNEVVQVVGTLVVKGRLVVDGATLILSSATPAGEGVGHFVPKGKGTPHRAGPLMDMEGAPVIKVLPGASLHIRHRATVAAQDPSLGFSIDSEPGSQVILEDSLFLHPGRLATGSRGMPEPYTGVTLRGSGAVVRGNTFRHGLRVIGIWSEGVVVEGNVFEHNAADITVNGTHCHIVGNQSSGAGHFLRLDMFSRNCVISNNEARWILRGGIIFDEAATSHQVKTNKILRAADALEMNSARGNILEDNVFTRCDLGPAPTHDSDMVQNTFRGNLFEAASGCEEVAPLQPAGVSDRDLAPLVGGRPGEPAPAADLPPLFSRGAGTFVPEPGVIGPPPSRDISPGGP